MDTSNFPFVWTSFAEGPEHEPLKAFDAFEAVLKRGEPFVLLSDSAPEEGHEHTQEDKKRLSLWMKKHKTELRAFVLGMILIEPNAAKRLAAKPFGVLFAKFWGYPLMLAASREEAMAIAENLLLERATSEAV